MTLPKLRFVGLDPRAPGVKPVPDRGMVSVGFDAFEVIVTLPVASPDDAGVKATVKGALCPADRVIGAVMPLRLKALPLIPT